MCILHVFRFVAILAATFLVLTVTPQAWAQIPTESGDLVAEIEAISDAAPGANSEGFVKPTAQELTNWRTIVDLLIARQYEAAHTQLADNLPTYELIEFTDTGYLDRVYYLLREDTADLDFKGWGTFVVSRDPLRPIAIEIPHPKFDTHTDEEGADMFRRTGAQFLVMAGTHRCANAEASTCSGMTTVCSTTVPKTNEAHRVSDVAHFVESPFHETHEAIVTAFAETYAVNLHGHDNDACPDIFLSNGHTTDVDPLLSSLQASITEASDLEVSITSSEGCTLRGTTNVQGRFTNGSANACTIGVNSTNGFFIHIEQSYTVRDNFSHYSKLIDALNTHIGASLPVELIRFDARARASEVVLTWATASETNNAGFAVETMHATSLQPEWNERAFIPGHGTTTEAQQYAFTVTNLTPGLHRFRLKQVDFDGQFQYSPVVEAEISIPDAFSLSPVQPNPSRGRVQFSLAVAQAQAVRVSVVDAAGREIAVVHEGAMAAAHPHVFTLTTQTWPPGVYVVRVQGETFAAEQTFVQVR